MQVKAIKLGFDGRRLQEAGAIFEMPDGAKSSWFVPVVVEKPKAKKVEAEKPDETSLV